ncbi:putative ankyrin repeat protein [Diplogelasinospora grovesii]|uniref:Ankyrin repeat protein n=1 Tax=Diplogelasinospora grovesii TaxID=303347 RepID=A0AAN6NCG4_9PEZI|nr:putative ankyrin repeat protein [Diplogelasinospora grovesii]
MSPASISALPTEIVVFVIENLDRLKDLSSLARSNRKLYSIVNPILYKRTVTIGDPWPLAWAAHCGVAGTLRKALTAGANPNYQFIDAMRATDWKKTNIALRAAAENEDNEVWESESEFNMDMDWSPETEDSDEPDSADTNQLSSNITDDFWGSHFPHDDDEDEDFVVDGGIERSTDAGSSTLDDHEPDITGNPFMSHGSVVLRRFNPIHLAARKGHNEIIEVLLDHGANVNSFSECLCDCKRLYGLLNAAECPEDETLPPPWSPLHIAICHSHTDTAKLLLSRGASYSMEVPTDASEPLLVDSRITALHHAAAMGLVDLIRYLLDEGTTTQADIDIRDNRTLTPLYHAYANRRWDTTVRLLHELGADINVDTKLFLPYSTITPLGEACRLGHFDEADRLIDLGADVTRGYIATGSGRGLSPLHMCCMPSARPARDGRTRRAFEEDERGARRMRTMEKLLAKGASLDATDCSGDTPLIAAAQNHIVPSIKALIKAGANIHVRNAVGRNAVMQAITGPQNALLYPPYSRPEVVAQTLQELLDAGVRIEDTDSDGNTVLHLGFKSSVSSFVAKSTLRRLLNKPGVSSLFLVRNKDGHTPLQLAFNTRNLDACEILIRRGCLRGGIDRSDLVSMFKDALSMGEAAMDFVLDLDTEGFLSSDATLFSELIAKDGYSALRVAQVIATRGLPPLPAADLTRLLTLAIRYGEIAMAYRILEAGADVNQPNTDGQSPLAAFILNQVPFGSYLADDFLRALLDRGADIHGRISPQRCQPMRILAYVIERGTEHEAEGALTLMLEKQPLANDARAVGGFYLHHAFVIVPHHRRPSERIIHMLLKSGASTSEINADGDTPLSVLLKNLCAERSFTWRYHSFIKALLGPDVDINRKNNDGKSIADYLAELMSPRSGSSLSRPTFLSRRIKLLDAEGGGKTIHFLPRPHRRVRPNTVMGS